MQPRWAPWVERCAPVAPRPCRRHRWRGSRHRRRLHGRACQSVSNLRYIDARVAGRRGTMCGIALSVPPHPDVGGTRNDAVYAAKSGITRVTARTKAAPRAGDALFVVVAALYPADNVPERDARWAL